MVCVRRRAGGNVAPAFGELFSGSTRLNDFLNPVTFTTEALLYHTLISISASVAFVEALHPGRRGDRWVASRRRWLAKMYFSNPVFLLLLWLVAQHVNRRCISPAQAPA